MKIKSTTGYQVINTCLAAKGFQPFAYQQQAWQHIADKKSGLVNAPTGCGKTYAVFIGTLINFINQHPTDYATKNKCVLQLIWITPLMALAKDIARAMEALINELGMQWKVGIRNGDTAVSERQKQKKQLPEILLITPESLHLLLAQKGYPSMFESLQLIAVDEWHELLGSKRAVQVELALSRIIGLNKIKKKQLAIWGMSATIGNLQEAKEVLLKPLSAKENDTVIIKAAIKKTIKVIPIISDEIEKYPWAGHLGIKLASQIIPIINQNKTTLIFINTRGMSETWYQTLLSIAPELSGVIALHHGSIEQALRLWVEDSLHTGKLKAVVCTASLDLGVDFRPVDTVVQVGSPKGVARFLQRAGRSGHQPGAVSTIYFLPTNSLELLEVAALKAAIQLDYIERKDPLVLCFDVLQQYLSTLAVGDGFDPDIIFKEIKNTHCFKMITKQEWQDLIFF